MESNKNNFQTIKENLCSVLDIVNEENTHVKQQMAILVEENRGLRQEIGSLIEKVNILVNLVDELKNNSNNFISNVQEELETEVMDETIVNEPELDEEVDVERSEYIKEVEEESAIENEFENEFEDESEDEFEEEFVAEAIEDEPIGESLNDSLYETAEESIEESIEEAVEELKERDAIVEEEDSEVESVEEVGEDNEPEVERHGVMADGYEYSNDVTEEEHITEAVDDIVNDIAASEAVDHVEYAEAAEVDYKKESIYGEEENNYKEEEISFELDLQEMESEEVGEPTPEPILESTSETEVVQTLEIEEPVDSAPKILHEASKPDWYDWEVDYPAPYVEDIQDGIGFNDKILFIRELFNDDDERFTQTIDNLNKFDRFKSATDYIRENFPDWDEEGDVVYRFYMNVRRKLRK